MKLYKITYLGGFIWHGTQANAKLGAKQIGGTFEQVDVPTDKDGLLTWLNENVSGVAEAKVEHDELEAAELRAVEEASRSQLEERSTRRHDLVDRDWDAGNIQEFVLNRATVAQCEQIFATLGTRFKELVKQVGSE